MKNLIILLTTIVVTVTLSSCDKDAFNYLDQHELMLEKFSHYCDLQTINGTDVFLSPFHNDEVLNELVKLLLTEYKLEIPDGVTVRTFIYEEPDHDAAKVFTHNNSIFFELQHRLEISKYEGGRTALAFELLKQLLTLQAISPPMNSASELDLVDHTIVNEYEDQEEYDESLLDTEAEALIMIAGSDAYDLDKAVSIVTTIDHYPKIKSD